MRRAGWALKGCMSGVRHEKNNALYHVIMKLKACKWLMSLLTSENWSWLFQSFNLPSLSPQRENKESRSPRSGAVDLPMVTDSIRNIKSMWEKGNVFTSPGGGGSTFKVKKKDKWNGGCDIKLMWLRQNKNEKGKSSLPWQFLLYPVVIDDQAWLTFDPVQTGSSCDKNRRCWPHQRLAE